MAGYRGNLCDILPKHNSEFNKYKALSTLYLAQGKIQWKQRINTMHRVNLGASKVYQLIGFDVDPEKFFKQIFSSGNNIPKINKNWGNLLEDVTRKICEMITGLNINDGITINGETVSASADGFVETDEGIMTVELKSPIRRNVMQMGKIPNIYDSQVKTQLAVYKAHRAMFFESQLIPCPTSHIKNNNQKLWKSFLHKELISCERPEAYVYVVIEPLFALNHRQYCLNKCVLIKNCICHTLREKIILPSLGELNIGIDTGKFDANTFEKETIEEIMGLTKNDRWICRHYVSRYRDATFLNKLENETNGFIMCYICQSYNTATIDKCSNIILKNKNRFIVAKGILNDFHRVFNVNFEYPWGDDFIKFITDCFNKNMLNISLGKKLIHITSEEFFRYIDPNLSPVPIEFLKELSIQKEQCLI